MQIAIFASTFRRPTLADTLDAVTASGLGCIHFDLSCCAGMPSMPDQIPDALCDDIRAEMAQRNLTMATVTGTYNMIHPNLLERDDGFRRLRAVASVCQRIGTEVISLCTGTRNPVSMWHPHPDNHSPQAWRDLVTEMRRAVELAETYGVTLAFEPEVANVVDSAQKGRRLLDEIQSRNLKVVIDGANLFHEGELPRMRDILSQAFDLLGKDIVLAHAKDLDHDGEAGHLAAGHGVLDYDHYLRLLHQVGFEGPLLLHGLTEAQVNGCVTFLSKKLSMF